MQEKSVIEMTEKYEKEILKIKKLLEENINNVNTVKIQKKISEIEKSIEKSAEKFKNELKRNMEYYENHIPALKSFLTSTINSLIYELATNKEEAKDIINNNAKIRKYILSNIKPYLEILKKNDTEEYKHTLEFITVAIRNKEEIIKQEKNKLDELSFCKIRQGTATNTLSSIISNKKKKTSEIFDDIAIVKKGEFSAEILNHSKITGIRTSTHKLLDEFMNCFTEGNQKNLIVSLPLSTHMQIRGLKDERKARQQIKEDLATLSNIQFSFTQKIEGKPQNFFNIKIIGSHGIENSIIKASFDSAFYNIILKYPFMSMPRSFFALSDKNNPNSYHLGRRITLHKNMNYGKKNEDIISVRTLLEACPNLADYEEIRKKKQQYTQKIIDPFERDMNALEEELTWEYCHSNGTPLTEEELENFNYDIFINLLIKVHWKHYPDREIKTTKKAETKRKIRTKKSD